MDGKPGMGLIMENHPVTKNKTELEISRVLAVIEANAKTL